MRRVLAGQKVCRPVVGPLAVHYCARLAGVSLCDYTLNPNVLADCVLRYYERFRPDAVWLSADTWVTAQAMGAPVAFPGPDQPMAGAGGPRVITAADIDRLPPPDPYSRGRCPLMLQAMRRLHAVLGRDVFLVGCFDQYPFSLACALMGLEQAMLGLADDRSRVEALMARCVDHVVAYGQALAEAGADLLSGGDSPAGLLGPALYGQVALPFEQRVIAALKTRTRRPVSLHICGNTTPILPDMAASGADVLELDHQVDMTLACRLVPRHVTIWGNLDPVAVLAQGSPADVSRAARAFLQAMAAAGHDRHVLSSGCTLAVETPAENLQALMDARDAVGRP
ncbi:MAG: uroporphyrinogen decarboxylase family protein [Verrucomicrobia bacterium]|nr:uroporphyrinogen decarboxylase family protein [Verrucomicrobiota bacterium]